MTKLQKILYETTSGIHAKYNGVSGVVSCFMMICQNKQIDVSFPCVCSAIDHEFCHDVAGQSGCGFADKLSNFRSCSLTQLINYKFMCLH